MRHVLLALLAGIAILVAGVAMRRALVEAMLYHPMPGIADAPERLGIDVVHALDHSTDNSYEVEIALVKIECSIEERAQILQIAEHFKARAVDYGSDSVILQANGSSEKVDAMIMLLRPYGIAELVRSGKLLMARGKRTT